MFCKHVWHPLMEAFYGTLDYLAAKLFLLIGSFPAMLALEIFDTPTAWWKGLMWLIIIDWVSGMIRAARYREFDIHIAVKKWYQVTGYIAVCGGAAILSNNFPGVFYYFQFAVYITFYLKEFFSILETYRLVRIFQIAGRMIAEKDFSIDAFNEFRSELEKSNPNQRHKNQPSDG